MTILLFVTGEACMLEKMGDNPTVIIKNMALIMTSTVRGNY